VANCNSIFFQFKFAPVQSTGSVQEPDSKYRIHIYNSKKKCLLALAVVLVVLVLIILGALLVRLNGSRTLTRAEAILSTLLLLVSLLALAASLWTFGVVRHFSYYLNVILPDSLAFDSILVQ